MLGAIFSLLASASFALNGAITRRGVLTGSPLHAVIISVPMGAVLFVIPVLVTGELAGLSLLSTGAIGVLALAGIIHFLGGRYCNYRSMQAAGANLVGPIAGLHLVVSLGLALALLDEHLTVLKIIGIALVMLGPGVALRGARKPVTAKAAGAAPSPTSEAGDARPAFQPKLLEGVIFASLTALIWGSSPILLRSVLVEVPFGLLAGLISYCAAALVILPLFLVPGQLNAIRTMDRTAARWFTIGGFIVFVSQLFRYAALAIAPVVVVEPLMRLSMVFRVFFSWIFNREHESFDPMVLLGTAVSLFGAFCLTIPTEMVLGWLPVPDAVAQIFLTWRWPG